MDPSTVDSAASHDDEMLELTLQDVEDAERRPQSKPRASDASASFETFTHEGTEANEPLSMPLTLPTSPTLLPLTSSPSSAHHRQLSVQQYFQSDSGGDFNAEMQKSNDEYRRLTDAINLNVPTSTGTMISTCGRSDESSTPSRKGKKRKQGTNVSIDLQTKIRIIEVAEQYQYDPKSSSRSKQDSGGMPGQHGKEIVNGIRLAEQFGLNKSTVSRILKRKEEFKKAYYKDNISGCSKHINKKSKFDKLNRLVENWFDMNREKNGTITDTLIRDVGKRYAEELGISDFRGSNGWVRSLRNRKEHTTRLSVSIEDQEVEKRKKDNEAIDRMRNIFPNGVKDMAGFFKDLSTYLEKDGAGMGGFGDSGNTSDSTRDAAVVLAGASYMDMDEEMQREDDGVVAEEFLKKKMIDSLRIWSQELMASELSKLKKRMKPRQAAIL
ncbi:Major centromere autoantigen B [Phytophthora citrophthora]|uniref:Major centromere autoantigen B n=1 Tax=Phytophthora citrophthora TaxID=4793 RepID=A0AAD9GMJ9_9STRA|nr:Major centromere autoantigen B [Phytophthora citrophthora]